MSVEEQVLRLEIAIDDVARVQVIKRLDDARRVEARGRFVEVAAVAKDRPQLAAQARLHQHVHELVVAVRVVQTGGRDTREWTPVIYGERTRIGELC